MKGNTDFCLLQGKRPHEVTLAEVKRPQEVKVIIRVIFDLL